MTKKRWNEQNDLILKFKDDPLFAKMKDAIRAFLDARSETDHIKVDVHYQSYTGYFDIISGDVFSTEMERKMDEIRASQQQENQEEQQ